MATGLNDVVESMRDYRLARGWQSDESTREMAPRRARRSLAGEAINKQLRADDIDRLVAATGVPLTMFAVPKPFEGTHRGDPTQRHPELEASATAVPSVDLRRRDGLSGCRRKSSAQST